MRTALIFVCLLAAPTIASGGDGPDAFARVLGEMGISAERLGYRPKAHWSRYPHPNTVPHVLPFFTDLLAAPLDTYPFARTLGNAAERYLTPAALRGEDEEAKDALYRLGILFGTDRRIGGFRGYGANLDPHPAATDPLYHALVRLRDRSGEPLARPATFGKPAENSEDPHEKLKADLAAIPEAFRRPLACFVLNLIDARTWIDRGLRKVPAEMRHEVFRILPRLAETMGDGTEYFPVIDDVAALVDEPSLHYGCLKALQAVSDLRRALPDAVPAPMEFRFDSPWGPLRIEADGVSLVVEFGPENGATTPDRTLAVHLRRGPGGPSDGPAARGVLGCGLVYTAGDSSDSYRAERWGLGAGLFGMGVLVDEGGDDVYEIDEVGLGAGCFGAGLLLDAAGNDRYYLHEGDGQGLGFPGGIGILADRSGDDLYYAEPDAEVAGRADYHSEHEVAVSNAQGAGSGRRGDGSDGHSWAGGLGALLDVDGNDVYRAGNFSQGIGYWYGTGLLWDGGGRDFYVSVYFTQGSGAHFAVGALIDEGGDDVHVLRKNAGAAFAFGWDVVNAFLIDRGDGNDRYLGKIISTGVAEVRSNAFFLDEGGDDLYLLNAGARGYGDVDQRESYEAPGPTHSYPFHLDQVAVFLDLGGRDRYLRRTKSGAIVPDPEAADGRTWHLRPRDPRKLSGPNVSIGRDQVRGRLGFLDPWPRRTGE